MSTRTVARASFIDFLLSVCNPLMTATLPFHYYAAASLIGLGLHVIFSYRRRFRKLPIFARATILGSQATWPLAAFAMVPGQPLFSPLAVLAAAVGGFLIGVPSTLHLATVQRAPLLLRMFPTDNCIVCTEAPAVVRLSPCQHRQVCQSCYTACNEQTPGPIKCIVCRAKVTRFELCATAH